MDLLNKLLDLVKPQKDTGFTDRLSYFWSVVFCALLAIFISGWAFVGEPIQCWFPAYYKGTLSE